MASRSLEASRNSRAGARRTRSVYQRIFENALSTLPAGTLHVVFPDGSEQSYGNRAPGPEAALRIVDPAFFRKCVLYGAVGIGEAWVDGDWQSDDLVAVLSWLILNLGAQPENQSAKRRLPLTDLLLVWNRVKHWLRPNHVAGARRNISDHYDLSNDFFALFLDPTMTYSCAYFETPEQPIEQAQIAKYDRLCRKLRLDSSHHLLEIGGGWGGFALHAARHYGCHVTSITVSEQQWRLARQRIEAEELGHRIDCRLQDYREVRGHFDRIVSIEMLEAVGHRYFEAFFHQCSRLLAPQGLLAIQVITCPDSRYDSHRRNVDWMQKHIFPGGLLPSVGVMNRAVNATGDLQLHDLEDLAHHYVRTLVTWRETFNRRLDEVFALGFDERFARKWNYYLQSSEAAFRTRNISVVQALFTRPNNPVLVTD